MSAIALSGVIVRLSLVIEAAPAVSMTGASAVMPELMTPPPFTPTAPVWARRPTMIVVAGKPLRVTSSFAFEPMILPVVSFAVKIVTVAVPVPLASASVIGGTTFAGERAAGETYWFCTRGVGGGGVGAAVVATATGGGGAAPLPAPPPAAAV